MRLIFCQFWVFWLITLAAHGSAATIAEIPLQSARARAVTVPSAPDAWGGVRAQSPGRDQMRAEQVVDYQIRARVDPLSHRIEGEQTLRWRNRSDVSIDVLYFHAYLNAFADDHSTFMTEARALGEAITIAQADRGYLCLREISQEREASTSGTSDRLLSSVCLEGPNSNLRYVQSDGGAPTDRSVFALKLARPVSAGQSTTLRMRFLTQLPRAIARSGHAGGLYMAAQWFPKVAVLERAGERGASELRWNAHEYHFLSEFYADFGRFDVTIELPKSMRVAATGRLLARRELADGWVAHRFMQVDVHDFAFVADARFAEPLRGSWQGAEGRKIAIEVMHTPDYAPQAAIVLEAIQASLRHAQEHLVEYPFDTVSAVIPPFNAKAVEGMEYPTLFTVTSPERVAKSSLEADYLRFVTVHEFFHNYFQGMLASNEIEEPWLDEGVNEYWNLQFLEALGERAITPSWLRALGVDWRVPAVDLTRSQVPITASVDALGASAFQMSSPEDYYSIYPRTALMLRDLQSRWGSVRMRMAMRHYVQTWQFRHPSSADFREALIEGALKCDVRCAAPALDPATEAAFVRELFAQLVDKAQVLDDRVIRIDSDCQPGGPAAGAQIQTRVAIQRHGAQLPQQLELLFDDGSRQRVGLSKSSETHQTVQIQTTRCPVSARLDPDNHYRMDQGRFDNTRSVQANGTASQRWRVEVFSVLTMLYGALLGF